MHSAAAAAAEPVDADDYANDGGEGIAPAAADAVRPPRHKLMSPPPPPPEPFLNEFMDTNSRPILRDEGQSWCEADPSYRQEGEAGAEG